MFKHEKGHSYINKPSIILVMHLIDIQREILRYITVTYRDNNQVLWNKKKCPVCMDFNCMPFSSAFEAVLYFSCCLSRQGPYSPVVQSYSEPRKYCSVESMGLVYRHD